MSDKHFYESTYKRKIENEYLDEIDRKWMTNKDRQECEGDSPTYNRDP